MAQHDRFSLELPPRRSRVTSPLPDRDAAPAVAEQLVVADSVLESDAPAEAEENKNEECETSAPGVSTGVADSNVEPEATPADEGKKEDHL
eukprot:3337573-Amphidinium_carterae.1